MLLEYFGERWAQGRCASQCNVCRGEVRKLRHAGGDEGGAGGGRQRAGGARRGKGKAAAAPAPAGFVTAAQLEQQQQQAQQQQQQGGRAGGPAGSSRALGMQAKAVATDGWRYKKTSEEKENGRPGSAGGGGAPAPAPAGFTTAARLAQQAPARAAGGKAAGAAGQKNTINSMFAKHAAKQ